jgi:1,4-dihydroxy-2-naphthoyl-CoA hydrolase
VGREYEGYAMSTTTTDFSREQLLSSAPLGLVRAHTVRFQDVDAAGVVFYPRILEYFHDAYVDFLRAAGHPLEEALKSRAWAAPIQWADAHFLKPMRFGDAVETAIVLAQVAGSELQLGFRTSLPDGKPAAIGATRAVFVDLATFRRTEAPPELAAIFNRGPS